MSISTLDRAPDWRDAAACRTEDPDLFFPQGTIGPYLPQVEQAKAVCRRCPVFAQCAQWAWENKPSDGIFAGLTEAERRYLRRRKKQSAPRQAAPAEPKPQTLAEAFAQRIKATDDGHVLWGKASTQLKVNGGIYSALRTAFLLGHGREPEGIVRRTCDRACYEPTHLTDARMRHEGAHCGTRPGYQRHLKDCEEPCARCRRANADADNRLRRTGTTKAAA
ncbi:hypothetical protein GCM10022384_07730 [Streptomyces marokkonensis]|uniref:Transcriptional regulator WhiB n=1 Tax=Streptomyces marokkonensis TaxID=324855 RepID=A0ABP7NZD1_9ACTN